MFAENRVKYEPMTPNKTSGRIRMDIVYPMPFIEHILNRFLHRTDPWLEFDTIVYMFYISK